MKQTFWITKHVISRGVYGVQAEVDPDNPRRIKFVSNGKWPAFFFKPDWYCNLEEAKKDARLRIVKRIESLENTKQKLLKLLETI